MPIANSDDVGVVAVEDVDAELIPGAATRATVLRPPDRVGESASG